MNKRRYQQGGYIKPPTRAVLYEDPYEGYAQGTFGKSYQSLSGDERSYVNSAATPEFYARNPSKKPKPAAPLPPPPPDQYEPSDGVKRLKGQLSMVGFATSANPVLSYAAQAAGATGDLYTAARYALDGQWGKAGEDALQGLIGFIPYAKHVKTVGAAAQQVKNYNRMLRAAQLPGDVEDISEGLQQGGNITSTGYLPGSPDRFNDYNIIPSNVITMDRVPHDILAIPDKGKSKIMKRNSGLHKFTGANYVAEVPVYTGGQYMVPAYSYGQTYFQDGGEGRLVDKRPEDENYKDVGLKGERHYYRKDWDVEIPAATGSGPGGAKYNAFLRQKLAEGISPQELARKRYISPGNVNRFMPYYKPRTDLVYTMQPAPQPVPVDDPTVGFDGEGLFNTQQHLAALVRYPTRNSTGAADPGTLSSPEQTAELMFVDDRGRPDASRGFYRIPGTVLSNEITNGVKTLKNISNIEQYRVPGFQNGGYWVPYPLQLPRAQSGVSYAWDNFSDGATPVRPGETQPFQTDLAQGTPTAPYTIQPIEKGRKKGSWNVQKTNSYGPNVEAATAFTAGLGMMGNYLKRRNDNDLYNNQINRATSDGQFATYHPALTRGYIDPNTGMTAPDRQVYTQFANQPAAPYYGQPPIAQQGMELPGMVVPQEVGSINAQVDAGMPALPAVAQSSFPPSAQGMYSAPTEGGYQAVKEFIKNQEGFVKKAAWDFKQFTNGYGTKAKSANEMISKEEADRRMDVYLMPTVDRIQSALKVPASNGQLTALASMAYNGGYGVVKKIINQMNNQVDPQEIANTIKRTAITVNNGEQVLPQLIKRRKKEASEFLQGYKVGGQYDISNDEIKRLMRQGYDLELI